jgi:hypothetical protein
MVRGLNSRTGLGYVEELHVTVWPPRLAPRRVPLALLFDLELP